jgi:Fic family protein
MEPMFPEGFKEQLAQLTCAILQKSGALSAQIPSAKIRARAAAMVTEMNSYYSNLIEGHKTLPRDIERALKEDFSDNPTKRENQHLSRAHIEVERLMLERLHAEPELSIHSREFLCWLHREFFRRLPEELQWSVNKGGKKYRIEPGAFRTFEVDVWKHQPPAHQALPQFLAHFETAYASKQILPTDQPTALAAAHHRLAWIHPFGDGNGRIARLYSHAWIVRAGIDSFGLWTLSRGLARQRQSYFSALAAADQSRWNDLDGRGNLSDRGLARFCVFMLQTMLDQIDFMTPLFQFENLATRIDRFLQFERLELPARDRDRLSRLLRAALIEGELERGRASDILGLGSTAARRIIRLALSEGLLDSPTEKGPLSLVFSANTLESYFPKLYQDLPLLTETEQP